MHPFIHAKTTPDKPAIIVAETGEMRTYRQLDEASNQVAQLFRQHGLGHDDVVAFMLENTPDYYNLTWGAQRAGLRYVCISSRLTADETDYILENSGVMDLWKRRWRLCPERRSRMNGLGSTCSIPLARPGGPRASKSRCRKTLPLISPIAL
jgi:hypothetical protein